MPHPFSSPAFLSLILVFTFALFAVCAVVRNLWVVTTQMQSVIKEEGRHHRVAARPNVCSCHLARFAPFACPQRLPASPFRGDHLVTPVAIPAIAFPPAGPPRAQLSAALANKQPAYSWRVAPPAQLPLPPEVAMRRYALAVRLVFTRVISITASGK